MPEPEPVSIPIAAPSPGKPNPAKSVFINCPYDPDYEPLFDAMIFTVVCCGFTPRSAIESGDISVARMDRIFDAIYNSCYSIHDLSRCQGEGEQMLARFNMPLELGIAIAWCRLAARINGHHDWLVLVPENAPYARFVSDLAGFDPSKYDSKPESLVKRVMGWLYTRSGALPNIRPTPVLQNLEAFRKDKAELKVEWHEVPWSLLVQTAAKHAPSF